MWEARDARRLNEMSNLSIYSALSNKEILRRTLGKRKQRATEMEGQRWRRKVVGELGMGKFLTWRFFPKFCSEVLCTSSQASCADLVPQR